MGTFLGHKYILYTYMDPLRRLRVSGHIEHRVFRVLGFWGLGLMQAVTV